MSTTVAGWHIWESKGRPSYFYATYNANRKAQGITLWASTQSALLLRIQEWRDKMFKQVETLINMEGCGGTGTIIVNGNRVWCPGCTECGDINKRSNDS